jgi:L-alanine-DL-glutamate epimerase-like enolase superfamily enzyme
VSADYSYTGDSTSLLNQSGGILVTRPSYSLANLRFGVQSGPSEASLNIRNLTNAKPNLGDIGYNANQWFTREFMQWIMPVRTEARVQLIEQPFPIGQESLLDGFESPVPIAADESVQSLADIPGLAGRFGVANIKL